jgi:ABC-type glycerol-3-phosphate transport system permease component
VKLKEPHLLSPQPVRREHRARQNGKQLLGSALVYATLSVLGLIVALPFLWTLTTALKVPGTTYRFPPEWIPSPATLRNFPKVFDLIPFWTFLRNSLLVTSIAMIGELLSASLVAYGFARFRFPGRNVLFVVVLTTMMIPYPVTIVPSFILFRQLGWVNTFLPLTVPAFLGPAFSIFLLRQFFLTISRDLDAAAKLDGASELRIFWEIILPLSKPALATIAVFSFVANWNDFLNPLIYLNDTDKYTLALGINFLRQARSVVTDPAIQMAGTLLYLLPPIVLLFAAQRYFVQGIVTTGMKE